MTQIKKYDEYKDSGIEWMGEMPKNWKNERLHNVVKSIKNGKRGSKPKENENDIYCIRVADFDRKTNSVEDQEFTIRNLKKRKQKGHLLKKGDLLIEKSGGGDKQPVGFLVEYNSNKKAIYANFMAKIELRNIISKAYFKYVNIVIYDLGLIWKSIKQTTGIQNLDTYAYLEEKTPLPPLQEQQKIASYLDSKTSKIDSLIENKKKMIQNLKEYKKSLITQAVTKGKLGDKYLNADGELVDEIEMKDSGIEWIGEMPDNWELSKMKFHCNIFAGGTPSRDVSYYWEGNIPWIKSGKIQNDLIKSESELITKRGLIESSTKMIRKNTTLLAMTGATCGNIGYLLFNSSANQSVMAFENYNDAMSKYIYYYLIAQKRQIDMIKSGSAQDGINVTEGKNIILLLPPYKEQQKIASYLDSKTSKIDKSIEKIEKSIELLEEYKTSLISHVVTGKRKVV